MTLTGTGFQTEPASGAGRRAPQPAGPQLVGAESYESSAPPGTASQAAKPTERAFVKPRRVSEKELAGKDTPDAPEVFTKQRRI